MDLTRSTLKLYTKPEIEFIIHVPIKCTTHWCVWGYWTAVLDSLMALYVVIIREFSRPRTSIQSDCSIDMHKLLDQSCKLDLAVYQENGSVTQSWLTKNVHGIRNTTILIACTVYSSFTSEFPVVESIKYNLIGFNRLLDVNRVKLFASRPIRGNYHSGGGFFLF